MRDEVSKNWAVSIYLQHFTDHCQCRLSWTQHIYKKKEQNEMKHNITKQLVANITTFSVVLSYQMVRIWWNKEVWYIENCIKRQNWEDEKMKKKNGMEMLAGRCWVHLHLKVFSSMGGDRNVSNYLSEFKTANVLPSVLLLWFP